MFRYNERRKRFKICESEAIFVVSSSRLLRIYLFLSNLNTLLHLNILCNVQCLNQLNGEIRNTEEGSGRDIFRISHYSSLKDLGNTTNQFQSVLLFSGSKLEFGTTRDEGLKLWRMPFSGMWRRVVLVRTDISEERIASIFRVEKSASEEPAWAGGCGLYLFIITIY
jgi:hypothetical protein